MSSDPISSAGPSEAFRRRINAAIEKSKPYTLLGDLRDEIERLERKASVGAQILATLKVNLSRGVFDVLDPEAKKTLQEVVAHWDRAFSANKEEEE